MYCCVSEPYLQWLRNVILLLWLHKDTSDTTIHMDVRSSTNCLNGRADNHIMIKDTAATRVKNGRAKTSGWFWFVLVIVCECVVITSAIENVADSTLCEQLNRIPTWHSFLVMQISRRETSVRICFVCDMVYKRCHSYRENIIHGVNNTLEYKFYRQLS